jgi:hypothetical protein
MLGSDVISGVYFSGWVFSWAHGFITWFVFLWRSLFLEVIKPRYMLGVIHRGVQRVRHSVSQFT